MEIKVIAYLIAASTIVGGVLYYGHTKYDSGEIAGKAEVQKRWDEDTAQKRKNAATLKNTQDAAFDQLYKAYKESQDELAKKRPTITVVAADSVCNNPSRATTTSSGVRVSDVQPTPIRDADSPTPASVGAAIKGDADDYATCYAAYTALEAACIAAGCRKPHNYQ